jgi:hypothetical protein
MNEVQELKRHIRLLEDQYQGVDEVVDTLTGIDSKLDEVCDVLDRMVDALHGYGSILRELGAAVGRPATLPPKR